jgi:Cu-Zn family superoxide dismutase
MSRHILFCLGLMLAVSTSTAQAADSAKADIRSADGKAIGSATLADTPKGVLITLSLKGAPEGVHAFHVHEVGKCEPPFKSAGAHFNPDHKKHGFVAEGPHAGDMPNLHIPSGGDLAQEVLNPNLSVAGMLDSNGSAVILHAKADDYKSDPAGNAGDRVACGVVEKTSP